MCTSSSSSSPHHLSPLKPTSRVAALARSDELADQCVRWNTLKKNQCVRWNTLENKPLWKKEHTGEKQCVQWNTGETPLCKMEHTGEKPMCTMEHTGKQTIMQNGTHWRKTNLYNGTHWKKTLCKMEHTGETLPEAQWTQGIESLTWVISPAKKNATCFGSNVVPLVLVQNFTTRWRH